MDNPTYITVQEETLHTLILTCYSFKEIIEDELSVANSTGRKRDIEFWQRHLEKVNRIITKVYKEDKANG